MQGRIQDFKLGGRGGGRIKKNCAERREARIFLRYFVSKITILRQKIIFFPLAEGGAKFVGVFRVENHDFTPNNLFPPIFFGGGGGRPPLDPPLLWMNILLLKFTWRHRDNRYAPVTINVRENRWCNQEWTIQCHWQHWTHRTNTKHNRKLKWWATQTTPKTGNKPRCARNVSSSCFL